MDNAIVKTGIFEFMGKGIRFKLYQTMPQLTEDLKSRGLLQDRKAMVVSYTDTYSEEQNEELWGEISMIEQCPLIQVVPNIAFDLAIGIAYRKNNSQDRPEEQVEDEVAIIVGDLSRAIIEVTLDAVYGSQE